MVPGRRNRKNKFLTLSLIFLISFLLMTVNVKSSKKPIFLESFVFWVITPFQNMVTKATHKIAEMTDHYFHLVNISLENKVLKSQIGKLIQEKNQLQEALHRQKRLYRLFGDPGDLNHKFVSASVVGRDATQWSKVIFINKGTHDGIQKNLAVVSNLGIIGHVIQAGFRTSKILPINDSRSAIDALFQESRIFGVVVGTGESFCKMKYVPIDAKVEEGDIVVSSGMGGIFPKGWVVGSVSQVIRPEQGLFKEVSVKPGADLARLEEVMALTP